MGTNNGKTRHIRIDLLYSIDYKQILNSGVIPIDGLCLQVHEYIAGPRIMFCSKCSLPGHSKGKCQHPYERCKRCGLDRNLGEHFEYEITCHNCKGDHISTDFSCPVVRNYRQDMIKHIQLHPEILPDDIQIFIPTFCRKNGEKTLSNYHHYSQQNRLQHPVNQNVNDIDQEWLCLPQPLNNTPAYLKSHHNYQSNPDQMKNIQSQMIKLERECEIAKNEYEKKNLRIENKLSSSITQLQSLFVCFSTIIQRQYEMISVLKSAVSECLQVNKVTNQIIRTLVNKNDNYQQFGEVGNQLELIPLDERNEAIEKLFSTYSPLVEDFTKKIMEVTNQFLVTNER